MGRIGAVWYLHDQVRFTAGYAYIHHAPAAGHQFVAQPEHRPWIQLQWFGRYPRLRTMQWLRLEERYRRNILDDYTLGEGYYAATRLRYNFALFIPLGAKPFQPNTVFGVLNDELHMNLGKVTQYFDQNRAFAGLGYQVNPHMQVHVGYMQLFQPRSGAGQFTLTHAFRIFLFQNLSWYPPKS
jgi:hypothetical protein